MMAMIRGELARRKLEAASAQEKADLAARCQADFLTFCIHALSLDGWKPAAHHRVIISYLQQVADGKITRLMMFAPPGSAKSTYVTDLFSAWIMARGRTQVIGASHNTDLAADFSGKIQRRIRENRDVLGYGLASENRGRWYTTNGCAYLAAGAGSGISGFRADVAIIDDPISSRKDAGSEANRKTVWEWYLGDLERRLRVGGSVILMHTRWHEDDLAGRLLLAQPDRWTVVKIPAICTEPDDPLGREIGEPLWADDDYGYGRELEQVRASLEEAGSLRDWESLYQQNPRPAEGTLFKVDRIEVLDEAPNLRGAHLGRGWDLAATKQIGTRDPDWTAGVLMARLPSGKYVVLNVDRFRGNPDEVDNRLHNIARQDGAGVKQSIPQDPGQAGKAQVLHFTRLLSGLTIEATPETGDKATRAQPLISQVNGGNVAIVRASWNRAYLDELSAFPQGAKDDQVDASARSFGIVGLGAKPLVFSDAVLDTLRRPLLVRR